MILVLGLGISNKGIVRLLEANNLEYEVKEIKEVDRYDYSLVIKSPGISYKEEVFKEFLNRDILVISDMEFVFKYIKKPIIAITGSNGKTTTTMLIKHLIEDKYKVVMCGNIGISIAEAYLDNLDADIFVIELSSFQLKGCVNFSPYISVILNINPCHIDYHLTYTDYINSKKNITIKQGSKDYLVYNYDDSNVKKIAKESNALKVSFSNNSVLSDCFIFNNYVYFNKSKILLDNFDISKENLLASISVCKILNIKNKDILNKLKTFKKPKYRIEHVKDNIYNDSKSTNVYSGLFAIKRFKNISLICGGYDKSDNLNVLNDVLDNISCIFTYGETKHKFYEYFKKNNKTVFIFDNLSEAFLSCLKLSLNNTILFSPMCASYDQYQNYIKRAEEFDNLCDKYL